MKKKADWSKADESFRRQVGALLGITGMTRIELAYRLNISENTLRDRMKHPDHLTKGEERIIVMIAKQNDVPYDTSLTV